MQIRLKTFTTALLVTLMMVMVVPTLASTKPEPPQISWSSYTKKANLKAWPKQKKSSRGKMAHHQAKLQMPMLVKLGSNATRTFETALLYSDAWTDYYTPYGVATFVETESASFTQIFENEEYPQTGGGFFTDKYYYMTTYSEDWFTGELSVYTYVYSKSNWEEVFEMPQDFTALATDLAYDAIDDVAYGCFNTGNGVAWGYMDPHDLSVTHLAPLEGELIAVAINSHGEAYAITSGGYLVKVNKKTGALSPIGYTGITPAYLQTATFDDEGVLYWAASLSDDTSGLYTVDLNTGSVTLVGSFPNNEEIVALYLRPETPSDGAPGTIDHLNASFIDDQLTGTVNFTIPSITTNGNELTGDVNYTVVVDGEELATGTATAGESVTAPVTLEHAGYHYFVVTLSNDAGKNTPATLRQWIGIDEPKPVSNVIHNKTGEHEATITWSAPTAGKHGGYFSADRLSYIITRLPDGKVVAEGLTSTTFVDNVDITGQALVRYSITVKADDVEGEAVTSNGIVYGDAFEVPVHFSFDSEEEFGIFTIIDNNETPALDSGCWLYSPSAQCTGYNTGTKNGDDWLITPAIALKADRQYTFQYDVCCYSDYWPDEYSVYMGNAATAEAMTTQLLPKTTIFWDEMRTMTFTITVPADGNYYFGFYATSEAGGAFFLIDDIKVTEGYTLNAPAQAENLTVTAGANGAPSATVSFIAPEKTVDGKMLTSLNSVTVSRGGQVVKTFDSPEPGEPLTFNESDLPTGMATYEIVGINEYGQGPAATGEAWIGIDYPTAPTNAKVSLNADGHPVITWQAPEGRGVYGGYVGDELTYSVYKTTTGAWVKTDIDGYSCVDESVTTDNTGNQSLLEYAVFAESAQGLGYPATAFCIDGANYTLPFVESFADSKPQHFWFFNGTNGEAWEIGDDWSYYSQDGDDGLLAYRPAVPGSVVTAYSGKIAMNGAKNPVLSFYLNKLSYENNGFYETNPDDDVFEVLIAADGFDLNTIKTIRMADIKESGYKLYEVPLNDYADCDFIMIAFKENAVSDQTPIMLDNIKIESRMTDDLSLLDITAPESVEVNEEFNVTVTVQNNGANDANNFALQLLRGEDTEQTLDNLYIAQGATVKHTFTLTADASWGDVEEFAVKIVYDADEDLSDNESEPVSIEIIHPFLPAPTDLSAVTEGSTATFTWQAPEGMKTSAQRVTDDFESYNHGDRTFGGWTTRDEATFGEYGIIDIEDADGFNIDFPHYDEEQAFMVFSPTSAWLDLEDNPQWAPHSGNKMLISICDYANNFGSSYHNNDWLISPQLSGDEQVITFYARTASATQRKDYLEVRYSTTGTESASFALLTDGNIQLDTQWTKYEFTLPAGTKYFALHNSTDAGTGVLVDDITFSAGGESPTLTLLGYNLYYNGQLVNEDLISGTIFIMPGYASGTYYVTAVYTNGESEPSNIVELVATSINNINIECEDNTPYYDLLGRRVLHPVENGIYLHRGKKIVYRR